MNWLYGFGGYFMYNNSLSEYELIALRWSQFKVIVKIHYSTNVYSFLSIISDNLHVPSRIHSNGHTEGASWFWKNYD